MLNRKEDSTGNHRSFFMIGALSAWAIAAGSILDIGISIITGGGNLDTIPVTAVGRFAVLTTHPLLGLYQLDLLNYITTLINVILVYAVFQALGAFKSKGAGLALVLTLIGTALFSANNAALGMLDLAGRYAAAADDTLKSVLAAAGEALLSKGAHGNAGAFLGFALITSANLVLTFTMAKSSTFSRAASWIGFAGNALLLVYLILVTFVPAVQAAATAFAAPGGLLAITWLILTGYRLFGTNGERAANTPA